MSWTAGQAGSLGEVRGSARLPRGARRLKVRGTETGAPWLRRERWAICVFAVFLGIPAALWAQSTLEPDPGSSAQLPQDPEFGTITGTVTAHDGTPLQGVNVQLAAPGLSNEPVARTDAGGMFTFQLVHAGPFELVATVAGFSPERVQGQLSPGKPLALPPIVLSIATAVSDVRVTVSEREIAQAQVDMEEKQRVFGVIPNFLVSYDWKPAPLDAKQKFHLSWRLATDPVSLGVAGIVAGVQQANNDYPGFGQGAAGYGKRFGADYGDLFIGTMLGSAVLPIVFRQDPRFLYKSTGSITNRALYAISATVICRSDKGKWEPNYSNVLGSLGAGAISNLYYPETNRNDAATTVENGLLGVATGAIGNLFEEFLVRKLTPHLPPATP